MFCTVSSCVRIIEFLLRLRKRSNEFEEARDHGHSALELI